MSSTANLKQIEKNSFRSLTQDGLEFIFVGIALSLTGLFIYDHRLIWPLALIPISYWMMGFLRTKSTYPRIGYAKLPPKTREKLRPALVCTLIAIIILLILGTKWMARFMPIYLGCLFAINSAVQARFSGDWLWYIFAGLFLASGFITIALSSGNHNLNVAIQLWCLSLILIAAGLVRFICFLCKYSIQAGGELNDLEG
jgi:hypothetical protein